jgi:hypothetical protein
LITTAHEEGIIYNILASNVRDVESNVMDPVSIPYSYAPIQPRIQFLFESGSGVTAVDSSGNGHDGLLVNGTAWEVDPTRGSVVILDGIDDHVTVDADLLAMDSWNEFTVAAWVKNDIGVGAGTDDIISWWRWTGYPCRDCSFVLTHHKNNEYFFQMGDAYLSGGIVGNDWTHVVATYDGISLRLYVNGAEVASVPYDGGIPISNADLIIGSQADGSNYFDGRVDSLEIYDVALTAQEVLSRYHGN